MIDIHKITTFELCTGVRLGTSLSTQSRKSSALPQGSTEHGGSMQNQLFSMLRLLVQQRTDRDMHNDDEVHTLPDDDAETKYLQLYGAVLWPPRFCPWRPICEHILDKGEGVDVAQHP